MKEYKYITNELINKGEVTITKYDSLLCKEVSDYNEHMVICREKKKELDKIQHGFFAGNGFIVFSMFAIKLNILTDISLKLIFAFLAYIIFFIAVPVIKKDFRVLPNMLITSLLLFWDMRFLILVIMNIILCRMHTKISKPLKAEPGYPAFVGINASYAKEDSFLYNIKTPKEYAEMACKKLVSETTVSRLEIKLVDAMTSIFDSKIGGVPYMPKDMEPPVDRNGKKMRLLAQINCRDLAELQEYPHFGILQFYLTTDRSWQDYKVIYYEKIDESLKEEEIIQRIGSNVQRENETFPVISECGMEFKLGQEAMSRADSRLMALFCRYYADISDVYISRPEEAGEEAGRVFEEYRTKTPGIGHKVGGYEASTQPADYLSFNKNEKTDVRSKDSTLLLFQLDSDYGAFNQETQKYENIRVMWGNAGVGKFYIKDEDLKKRDFSKVSYRWDCYDE